MKETMIKKAANARSGLAMAIAALLCEGEWKERLSERPGDEERHYINRMGASNSCDSRGEIVREAFIPDTACIASI